MKPGQQTNAKKYVLKSKNLRTTKVTDFPPTLCSNNDVAIAGMQVAVDSIMNDLRKVNQDAMEWYLYDQDKNLIKTLKYE